MNVFHKPCLFAVMPLALLLTTAAHAQTQDPLTVTLSPSPVTVAALANVDQTVSFTATLTNTSSMPLYLNGDNFDVDFPLSVDDSAFINTFVFPTDSNGDLLPQPTLDANSLLSVPLFDVLIPAGTAGGDYNGSFQIQGGETSDDYALLSAPGFAVSAVTGAAVAPEPSSLTILALGLVALGGMAAWKRRPVASSD